jgi:hypothetical protein
MNSDPAKALSDANLSAQAQDFAEADQVEWDAEWELDTEWEDSLPPALRLVSGLVSRCSAAEAIEEPSINPIRPQTRQVTGQIAELLSLPQRSNTCRIWVDHPPRRLLALQVETHYYSFLRLMPTRVAALKLAERLSRAAHHLLITIAEPTRRADQAEAPYAVWLRQPEAKLAELELLRPR